MSAGAGARATTGIFQRLPNSVGQILTAAYFKAKAFQKVGLRGSHSSQKVFQYEAMKIKILPALSDNYMYLIVDEKSNEAAIVDPVAPETVLAAVKDENVKLTTVLTTHHHWDHAGGNKKLSELVSDLRVFGGDDRIEALTEKVSHGQEMTLGSLNIRCLSTPCHTKGHICYLITSPGQTPVVFTGDTLFLGGCGRFFEGDATQMNRALNEVLASLDNQTLVYCGHEYSIQNLSFGLTVEPDNDVIKKKLEWSQMMRDKNPPEPTVPSTIGEEKELNPFMRVSQSTVRHFVGDLDNDIDTMTAVRAAKDKFKM